MKEILLCKYGEVILKGLNKNRFESMMVKELEARIKKHGDFKVSRCQSTVYVEPQNDGADIDGALESARKVFGFVSIARACQVEKNMDDIISAIKEYIPQFIGNAKTFKADARRSDKRFPLTSPEIAAKAGEALLTVMPRLRVNVREPEITVMVEIRESQAYIHAGSFKGAGGLPTGSSGKCLSLLSGGIDSPVATYMMARRGAQIEALHFESFPYTSERAKEKVMRLAAEVNEYAGHMKVHVISLTHIQEELRRTCDEDYFTLLLRRFMMRLAQRVANERECLCLATGESLGQVASQTMQALVVTDDSVSIPVLRPCIGMDKEDIIKIAREIGTFDTSILPYEDCCTVFTPRHPKTMPVLSKVVAEEAKVDIKALEDEAFATLETIEL